ncbi:DUF1570 domain-containing protein [uncultured Pseudoteredinibacter sp.]|uniref:DUF1570 domain-containing protein n=1 Tax=uncultured Pseudoteredinibacter sp. TaxID=1641701 RepID=UPI0026297491|nr:DUF1570 domain-containing protein [uncultured Pseudoteredinibacter sp.]
MLFNKSKVGLFTLFFWGLSLISATAVNAELLEEDWLRIESNHFTVYSALGEKKSREIVLNLEAFRRAALALTNIHQAKPRVPTKIYLVKKSHLSELDISRNIAGYIRPEVDKNTIFVSHSPRFDGSTVIYHEYVHFLLRNHSQQRYPRWYDEGFAEYLASVKTTDKHFQVGQIAEHRLSSLQYGDWLNVRSVINPIKMDQWSDEKYSQFYANAWLLVHFLNNHPDFKGRLSESLSKYFKLKNQGVDNIDAFESAFSIKVSRLNARLKSYFRRGRATAIQYDKAILLNGISVNMHSMPKAEAAMVLSEFAVASKNNLAGKWLEEAGKNPDQLVKVKLLEKKLSIGKNRKDGEKLSEYSLDDFSEELSDFEDLIQQARNIVDYLQATRSRDPDMIALARAYLLKAWKQDKESPAVYFYYGKLYLIEGKDSAKAIDMLAEAEYFLPANLQIRLNFARALAWAGKKSEAYAKAESVANWTHEGSGNHKYAKRLMKEISSSQDSDKKQ